MTAAAFGMVASSGQQRMDTAWGSKREARFEGVAGGDLRDETLLTAACQELRAASSKLQRLARHCPTNIQLLV